MQDWLIVLGSYFVRPRVARLKHVPLLSNPTPKKNKKENQTSAFPNIIETQKRIFFKISAFSVNRTFRKSAILVSDPSVDRDPFNRDS